MPSFISSYLTQPQYNVISDEVKVTVTDLPVSTEEPEVLPSTAAHTEHGTVGTTGSEPEATLEEVDVEETLLLEERSPKFWRTLLTGMPSPTSTLLSLLTFLINLALLAMATDLIYRAKTYYPSNDVSFARVGYVGENEAKLVLREPDAAKLPVYVSVRTVGAEDTGADLGWRSIGSINYVNNITDHTAVLKVPIPKNKKRVKYQYVTSNNHTGYFTSAPRIGYTDEDGPFTFLTSSCITPRFPYNPFKHPLSIPGFQHLAKALPSLNAQFMLFLGDFIYVDVPKRFGQTLEDYRRPYRQVYASPDWPAAGQNLSWIHVIDDHEIANDFDSNAASSPSVSGAADNKVYQAAIEPWYNYQGAANPPLATEKGYYNKPREHATYFEFVQGPAAFFMLDTRRYRDSADLPATARGKSMLGQQQREDLLAWLEKPLPRGVKWKIVASSVPFTKNWRVNGMDTWAGFLDERQTILEAMWDVGLKGGVGVVVLSGDRHEFAATAFPPPKNGRWPLSSTVHEYSTSPLSQFYLPVPSYSQQDEEDVMIK